MKTPAERMQAVLEEESAEQAWDGGEFAVNPHSPWGVAGDLATADAIPYLAHSLAAFQLAWIDRGLGSPIAPERVEWLRSMGVRDDRRRSFPATPGTTTT